MKLVSVQYHIMPGYQMIKERSVKRLGSIINTRSVIIDQLILLCYEESVKDEDTPAAMLDYLFIHWREHKFIRELQTTSSDIISNVTGHPPSPKKMNTYK